MVLKPLEFADCLTDSPWFRANLRQHEQALERAYKTIKLLESQSKELLTAELKLQTAHRNFANTLQELRLETIGSTQTDDELTIANSLKEYSKLIMQVEDQRSQILEDTERNFIEPFRRFRIDRIGNALQHERKKYEKANGKFYQSLEKHLHLSTSKKSDFTEADAGLDAERRQFYKASLDYVCVLQSVQERMKFEFVENLSSFLYSCLTFYHVGHVIHEDFKPYLDHVKERVQKARDNFIATQEETEELKRKMLRLQNSSNPVETCAGRVSVKQGYLYLLEKKNLVTSWTKYYCVYQKETRIFALVPVSQTLVKDIKEALSQSVSFKMKSCVRRASDTIDKRFCFDVISDCDDSLTFQALSEDDRRTWLNALDGKEPFHSPTLSQAKQLQTTLKDGGLQFVSACLDRIEARFIDEQGLYRNCGVGSKVQRLLTAFVEQGPAAVDLQDEVEWDGKTLTSVVKAFLRYLPEPLMTFRLHSYFLNAAKMKSAGERVDHIHFYVHQLPPENFQMLKRLAEHLRKVAQYSMVNLMTAGNLAVCFGPCVMRDEEETVAAIMDIKFCNLVIEILVDHFEQIFCSKPKCLPLPPPEKPIHACQAPDLPKSVSSLSLSSVNSQSEVGCASSIGSARRTARTTSLHSGSVDSEHTAGSSMSDLDQLESDDGFRNARTSMGRTCIKYPRPYTGDALQRRRDHLQSAPKAAKTSPPTVSRVHYTQSSGPVAVQPSNRVRTLYECHAACGCQLSFVPGQILTNVRPSSEPGWLVGSLNGKTGLVPASFVELLP